jgi:DNA processing protein
MSSLQLEISSISANTQAILLLTAPLIAGRRENSPDLLTTSEYGRVARFLYQAQRQPADLVAVEGGELFSELGRIVNSDRLKSLLGRGFLLSQAIDRWQTRSIWVISRADEAYPARLKERLKEMAPPILYGCGDSCLLNAGGLAVVGSRQADEPVIESTIRIGELAARARCSIISGGARGIDQASMSGALNAGGKAIGVLADSLERSAVNRDHRSHLIDENLVLISPYDPSAGFNVGNAMQRNKLIYALADAALVVQADYGKGGTWTGAMEQLEKLRLVPVYTFGDSGTALKALQKKGALAWPNPTTPDALQELLAVESTEASRNNKQLSFAANNGGESDPNVSNETFAETPTVPVTSNLSPSEELFATVRSLLERIDVPQTDKEIASELKVSTRQAKEWLKRLVNEGALEKLSAPTRYRSTKISMRLF